MLVQKFLRVHVKLILAVFVGLMTAIEPTFAAETVGTVANRITESFTGLTNLVTGGCYIAGLAFAVTAILQFKQHKDNPTQITVGKPISLVFIAAALLFMPSVLTVAGFTMFGDSAQVAGPTGQIFDVR